MAKAATRTTARPAQRGAQQTQPQRAQPAQSGGSKAQQAARHQEREPEARPAARQAASAPVEDRRATVPAQPRQQQVARSEDFGNVTNVPAFMRNDVGMGKENIGREDIEVPRLKLMQGLSPELNDFNELRPGHFFHTASEMIFDAAVFVVPVYMDRRYILWRPRDSGGGILARADDGIHWSPSSGNFTVQLDKSQGGRTVTWSLEKTVQQSGLANWGTMDPDDPNSPPAATLMYSFVLAFPEHPELMPAVLTFQRSSIKTGRRFNTKLKTVRTPLFGLQFELTSFEDTNSRGQSFYNINMRGAGLVEDEAAYNQYKEMHLSLRDQGLQIKDIEGLQDEDPEGDAAEPEGDGNRPAF